MIGIVKMIMIVVVVVVVVVANLSVNGMVVIVKLLGGIGWLKALLY